MIPPVKETERRFYETRNSKSHAGFQRWLGNSKPVNDRLDELAPRLSRGNPFHSQLSGENMLALAQAQGSLSVLGLMPYEEREEKVFAAEYDPNQYAFDFMHRPARNFHTQV